MPKFAAYLVTLESAKDSYPQRPVGMNNLVAIGEYSTVYTFTRSNLTPPNHRTPDGYKVAIFNISRHSDEFIKYL